MKSLPELVQFLKQQSAFHAKQAASRKETDPKRRTHAELSEKFAFGASLLEEDMEGRDILLSTEPHPGQSSLPLGGVLDEADEHERDIFSVNPLDLEDLPPELAEQLHISKADQADARIIQLLRIANRPLTINELLVGLYRRFGEKQKRSALAARLYRMSARGELDAVSKGMYQLQVEQRTLLVK